MPTKTESVKTQSKPTPSKKMYNKKTNTEGSQQTSKQESSVETVKKAVKKPSKVSESQTPAPVQAPTQTGNSTSATEGVSVYDQLSTVLAALNELTKRSKQLESQVKNLQKLYNKERKVLLKAGKKSKKQNNVDKPKRAPSGFAKPTGLSPQLCQFLGISPDTQLARTDVTKKITAYVKEHGLQNPEKKTQILPDAKLGALLNVPSGEQLTYFNLQKYMKVHFQKAS